MKLNVLLDYLNFVAAKETEGESMPPTQFSTVLESVNIETFEKETEMAKVMAEAESLSIENVIDKNPRIRPFKKTASAPLNIGDSITLPSDFGIYLSLSVRNDSDFTYRIVEPISQEELARRYQGVITRSFDLPVSVYNDAKIQVIGDDFTFYLLFYVKVPTTPYFDYCIDVDIAKYIYINVGDYIELNDVTTQYELKNSGGAVLNNNVTHTFYTSGGTGIYTSISVELEWEEKDHIFFARQMLIKMGINLRDQQLQRYAEQSNAQQQQQA
jgi:hypothetical protein